MTDRSSSFVKPPIAGSARLLLFAAAIGASACASSDPNGMVGPVGAVGQHGRFDFSVAPNDPPHEGPNDMTIVVRDVKAGVPVSGATLDVRPYMAAMAHDTAAVPEVANVSDGTYDVRGLVFSMPGIWEVQMHAEKDALVDDAAVTFDVP